MTGVLLYAPAVRRAGVTPLRLAVALMLVMAPLLLIVLAPVAGCLTSPTARQSGTLTADAAIPDQFRPLVEQAAQAAQIHPALLAGLARAESGWNPTARSPVGAAGLTQLMPATARGLGVTDVYDPADNLTGGARYLRQQLDTFGSVDLALAAYNAGPGNVHRYGGIPPFAETQAYVPRVKGYAAEYGWVDGGASVALAPASQPPVAAAPRSAPGAWGGYSNGYIPGSALAAVPGHPGTVLRPDAAAAMGAMVQAAAADGVTLNPGGGYRSYDDQVRVRAAKPGLAAKPGTSNHGWALATDMQNFPYTSSGYIWVAEHGMVYGWGNPAWAQRHGSKEESWHLEHIGVGEGEFPQYATSEVAAGCDGLLATAP